jgi:hypothetical protein
MSSNSFILRHRISQFTTSIVCKSQYEEYPEENLSFSEKIRVVISYDEFIVQNWICGNFLYCKKPCA